MKILISKFLLTISIISLSLTGCGDKKTPENEEMEVEMPLETEDTTSYAPAADTVMFDGDTGDTIIK